MSKQRNAGQVCAKKKRNSEFYRWEQQMEASQRGFDGYLRGMREGEENIECAVRVPVCGVCTQQQKL